MPNQNVGLSRRKIALQCMSVHTRSFCLGGTCRLDKYDTIGAPSARKLSALALCVLLTLPLPALLERLDVMLPHVTSTWLEVTGSWPCPTFSSPKPFLWGSTFYVIDLCCDRAWSGPNS